MSNAQDWIDATRARLMSGHQEQLNRLEVAYTAGSGTMSLEFTGNGVRNGTVLSAGTATFYVWDFNTSTNVATVQGGWDGTSDQDLPVGTVVRVQPRFTDAQILRALNEDVVDLCSPANGLFQIATAELSYDMTLVGYDLSTAPGLVSIIEVRIQDSGNTKNWARVPSHKYRILKGAPYGEDGFESGSALFLYDSVIAPTQGSRIHITYRKAFNQMGSAFSSKSGTGLPATAWDLPPIGAAISLMAGREIKRSFTESQGDTRRATEVGVGASIQSVQALRQLRAQRIESEKQRLDAFYPIVKDA